MSKYKVGEQRVLMVNSGYDLDRHDDGTTLIVSNSYDRCWLQPRHSNWKRIS